MRFNDYLILDVMSIDIFNILQQIKRLFRRVMKFWWWLEQNVTTIIDCFSLFETLDLFANIFRSFDLLV